MRDLTKSMVRFSWAMSLYGLDRMREMVEKDNPEASDGHPGGEDATSRGAESRSVESLDSLSEATGERLRDRTRRVYEAGDRLQEEMVDLFFDALEPARKGFEHLFENAADVAERSAEAFRKASRKQDEGEAEAEADPEAGAEAAAEASAGT
jgi:hypothetical protein